MKKSTISIAALAIATASVSFAFRGPVPATESKTYCLKMMTSDDGATLAETCDQSGLNRRFRKPLLSNGCAANQIAVTTEKVGSVDTFPIQISSCLPPNVTQL